MVGTLSISGASGLVVATARLQEDVCSVAFDFIGTCTDHFAIAFGTERETCSGDLGDIRGLDDGCHRTSGASARWS